MNKENADKILIEYLPKIYGFAVAKSFSYDEAEEISADIVKELYVSLLKSKEIYNIDGYVWRISEHVYSKYVSSVKKHEGVSLNQIELSVEDVYDFGDNEDEYLRLRREIAFLTQTRREIIYSYYYENKPIKIISKDLCIPIGTVKWHLNKARCELREGLLMERKIGKLGMKPIKATNFGHGGEPEANGGPKYYLNDSLNLNIVYSVYHTPRTKNEIAEELGVTPVFIEDKIEFLESNGFLVRKAGNKYTTYVGFEVPTYSLEKQENKHKKQLEIARILVNSYVDSVIEAISDIRDVYIPSGNRQLLEAAAVFYGVSDKCNLDIKRSCQITVLKQQTGEFILFLSKPKRYRLIRIIFRPCNCLPCGLAVI